ncbi:hypothetical protein GTO91_01600 [Heliobacterium undosum]|uniref:Uncharacterized protein n=1 Tax=Heliomicrobium undosum TaxID=121734 RepID=A0A845KXP8_9FIRM|nr:hypothetical protein [Heliomicrobium undosum]MZP28417.1 hypothetical protein [Heliomicrobium undosum]
MNAPKRRRWIVGILVLALLGGVGAWWTWRGEKPPKEAILVWKQGPDREIPAGLFLRIKRADHDSY